ncbi:putative disease resistance protein [Dorcoceras hygrometricum]|uniref:Putative disease resistance protein n=1 Tax=Dorcoceras hygrometricum TaxID=472368 RepID=A0A2Z7BNT5_9LAMI|nr:putative disease resistance protein [Dorcoceras hygrometricum]
MYRKTRTTTWTRGGGTSLSLLLICLSRRHFQPSEQSPQPALLAELVASPLFAPVLVELKTQRQESWASLTELEWLLLSSIFGPQPSSGTSSSSDSEEEVQCLMANDTDETALSKLKTENDDLRSRSQEMMDENKMLAEIISSWTKSSPSLQKLQGVMKPSGDKIGLGYER